MSSNPKAEIQITAESRTLAAKLREVRAQFGKFGGALRKEVFGKALFEGPKASAHMFGQLGANAVSGGLGLLADQAHGVAEFNEQLVRFQIAARKTPEETREIGGAAREVSDQVGLAAGNILSGEQAFIDLAGAENASVGSMRSLARAAQASGSAIADMATVSYSLTNALHIKPTELEDTIGGLINQSKDGTVHFKNMAEDIIAVAPKFARFGVTGRQGAAELGAMFQVVRSGFKDSAETATGLEGIFRGLVRNADKFKKAGVNVFTMGKDGVKHLRPVQDIFAQIEHSKLFKDPSKLIKAFGRGEGEAAFRLLVEQAEQFLRLVEAGKKDGVVQADLATYTASASGRTAIAFERMKNAIAEAFTPERIERFVGAIEGLADKIGPVARAVGTIGDALGKVYGAGQWVHGALLGRNDNANPWKDDEQRDRVWLQKNAGGIFDLDQLEGRIDKGKLVAMRLRRANKAAYDATVSDIVGSGDPDRATPESIQRAVIASHADPSAAGGAGRVAAAGVYLRNANVGKAEADEIYTRVMADQGKAMQALLDKVTNAIKAGFKDAKTEVKADGKSIVDVHRAARVHAARPGG